MDDIHSYQKARNSIPLDETAYEAFDINQKLSWWQRNRQTVTFLVSAVAIHGLIGVSMMLLYSNDNMMSSRISNVDFWGQSHHKAHSYGPTKSYTYDDDYTDDKYGGKSHTRTSIRGYNSHWKRHGKEEEDYHKSGKHHMDDDVHDKHKKTSFNKSHKNPDVFDNDHTYDDDYDSKTSSVKKGKTYKTSEDTGNDTYQSNGHWKKHGKEEDDDYVSEKHHMDDDDTPPHHHKSFFGEWDDDVHDKHTKTSGNKSHKIAKVLDVDHAYDDDYDPKTLSVKKPHKTKTQGKTFEESEDTGDATYQSKNAANSPSIDHSAAAAASGAAAPAADANLARDAILQAEKMNAKSITSVDAGIVTPPIDSSAEASAAAAVAAAASAEAAAASAKQARDAIVQSEQMNADSTPSLDTEVNETVESAANEANDGQDDNSMSEDRSDNDSNSNADQSDSVDSIAAAPVNTIDSTTELNGDANAPITAVETAAETNTTSTSSDVSDSESGEEGSVQDEQTNEVIEKQPDVEELAEQLPTVDASEPATPSEAESTNNDVVGAPELVVGVDGPTLAIDSTTTAADKESV